MPVHPQARAVLDADADAPEPASVEEARERFEERSRHWARDAEPVHRVHDEDADGVPVRVYVPEAAERLPAVLWMHGGGWVLGSLDSHDPVCRALCNASGAVVVSVGYRLAPEAQHPAQLEDCSRALEWLLRSAEKLGVDPSRVAVAGDSAGGNLAAVLARRARERLRFQLLVYPVTDGGCATRSYETCGGPEYGLPREQMVGFWQAYVPRDDMRLDPDASPLRAEDLQGAPPALVIGAEFDPLRDEGTAYAERLRAAGVEARASCYDGMVHGFFRWRGAVDAAQEAMEEAGAALREALPRK